MLLVDLLMELFVACFLALDYEMLARLERRVVSGETGTGVNRMPDSDV